MSVTIGDLPEEMLIEVFKYLDGKSVKEAALQCKEWNRVISTTPAIMKKFVLNVPENLFEPNSHEKYKELMSLERKFVNTDVSVGCVQTKFDHNLVMDVFKRFGERFLDCKFFSSGQSPPLMLEVVRLMPELEELSVEIWYNPYWEDTAAATSVDSISLKKLKKLKVFGVSQLSLLRQLEKILKAALNLEFLWMQLDDLEKMDPDFPFRVKEIYAYRLKLTNNTRKFLLSQAATVERLEVECDNSEFHEIVLTNFKRLQTLRTNLKKLIASEKFFKNLKPMPSLTELTTDSGFSSTSAMRAVLGNCPNLEKFRCQLDEDLPNHLEFIADHNKKLEVLEIKTIRKTAARFQCLEKLRLDTVTNTADLLSFLISNPSIETLDIEYLELSNLNAAGARSLITTTKLKHLKISGYMNEVKEIYDGIKNEFAKSTTVKLSFTVGPGFAELRAEITRETTGATESKAAKRKYPISHKLLPSNP